MEMTVFVVLTVAIVPLTGLCVAITPWVMRRNECFAVTVPKSAQSDLTIKGYKTRYTTITLVLTAVLTALVCALLAMGADEGSMVAMSVGLVVVLIVSFMLMLHYRGQVVRLKEERGWHAEASERAALVGEGDVPRALPVAWELLNVPVIIVTALVSWMLYPSMPDRLPMQMDLTGQVSTWVDKSPVTLAFPLLIQAVILVSMVFSHVSITRSKRPVDPSAPATSAYAYGLFAHAQSVFLVVFGLLINAAMICLPLSFAWVLTMAQAALVIIIVAVVCVIGSVALSVVYGQAGSRIAARVEGEGGMVDDDDEHWKLGILYFDPDDASVFLPERFGVGWTVNYARPQAWLMIAGLVAAMVVLIVVSMMMVG